MQKAPTQLRIEALNLETEASIVTCEGSGWLPVRSNHYRRALNDNAHAALS